MIWNWQQSDWPKFAFDASAVEPLERHFLFGSGQLLGVFRHIGGVDRDALRIELIRDEALKTSEIEGEILDRESVQSSLLHQFGLGPDKAVPAAERGIAEMMVDLFKTFAKPLSDRTLLRWHSMLMRGGRTISKVGHYREHGDPMQVVSGPLHKRKVHFEAPPSADVKDEMRAFVDWFNDTGPDGGNPMPPLTRAGLAHLYFVCIHPFEDGNGRIGRAIAEKALAQNLGQPTLIALAYTIERKRKNYYAALERNNKDMEITDWLTYFAETIVEAQANTLKRMDFYVAKAKFHERLRDQLNERQQRAIARMFREGVEGFKGGMSAEKYIAITQSSRATATRDLQDLVGKGALTRTGELRHTRYQLALGADQ
ncbi:Fic family protein [soil metagenome]